MCNYCLKSDLLKNLLHFKKSAAVLHGRGCQINKQLYKRAFLEFLINQISEPQNAEKLIELAHKSLGQKTEEVFHTYLLFEKYLTTFEQDTRYDRDLCGKASGYVFPPF